MHKINDRLILGLVVGFLANIPKTIVCTTLNYKGITKRKCSDIVASIFIPHKYRTKSGNVFGILCDFITASFDGIFYIYLLSYTGKVTKSNALIKGLITGIFSFGLFRGLFSKFGTGGAYPKDIFTNIMMGLSSSVWGVTVGLLTLMLGHKDLLELNSRNNVPDVNVPSATK